MDSNRFDQLTLALAVPGNRRRFIRVVFGAGAAGIGFLTQRGATSADPCKDDGKACKKHEQCCSGVCFPDPSAPNTATSDSVCCTPEAQAVTCAGRCGFQTNNCGQQIECPACCVPDPDEVTCSGVCGSQTNNCGESVQCRLCDGGEMCSIDDDCASDICCEDSCVDCSTVSDTATVCGFCDNCCECFAGDSFGPAYCCDPDNICGTYPNDICCSNSTVCVGGDCVKPEYVCPYTTGGEVVDCRGVNGAGCCNGLCCPNELPVCLNGACHAALPECSYPNNMSCPAGSVCTGNEWNLAGVCCASTSMHSWVNGTIVVNECCTTNEKWVNNDLTNDCPTCIAKSDCGCEGSCTSRTSTPRITG